MVVTLSSLQRINVQLFSLCFLRFSILSFNQLHLVACNISNIDIKQNMRYFQFMVGNVCCSVLDTYMPEMSTDQDWIGLDQEWSHFWPDQDWIGLQFLWKFWIRTGSESENFWCCYVIILNILKLLVVIRSDFTDILPSVAKALLGIFCNSNCFHLCPHIRLNSCCNVNVVEWLVSMPAVRVFVGSALTLSFDLACRDYTFDRSAFYVLFQNV